MLSPTTSPDRSPGTRFGRFANLLLLLRHCPRASCSSLVYSEPCIRPNYSIMKFACAMSRHGEMHSIVTRITESIKRTLYHLGRQGKNLPPYHCRYISTIERPKARLKSARKADRAGDAYPLHSCLCSSSIALSGEYTPMRSPPVEQHTAPHRSITMVIWRPEPCAAPLRLVQLPNSRSQATLLGAYDGQ